MQLIKKKIQSRRGASITYALLLFLVAAVIGSVVLAAGTAAGGRLSQTAQMDQRYYSVNSAARLLIDTITKDTVTVEALSKTGEAIKYTYKVNTDDPKDLPEAYPSLTVAAAATLAKNPGSYVPPNDPIILTIKSTELDGNDTNIGLVDVKAEETLLADGSIHLEVYNTDSNTQQYRINITLSADKQQNRTLDIAGNSEIVTTTLSWKLAEIENAWSLPTVPSSPTPTTGG